MIANKDGGVSPRSADHFMHRLSSRWNPLRATNDVEAAQDRTRTWLLSRQNADGHWVGELEGDTILESEYLLLLAFLGRTAPRSANDAPATFSITSFPKEDGRSTRVAPPRSVPR